MKSLEKIFFRLNGREQFLLVLSLWVVFAVSMVNILKSSTLLKDDWSLAEQSIRGHKIVIDLKPVIDAALEQQKTEQQNKSYDKNQLSNLASRLADQVFPQRDYRELDSDERERYKQHRVRIKFQRASYEDVNEYAALIRQESPFMFLSEVEIEPNYPPKNRPYDPTTFDATFEVSSVEFLNP
ncbi:MAG: hypothetical protein CBC16_08630 [Verrucomicrobia bacterium TMED56]|jgi:hypothetical protein|nr:MAG: hypothetical protein CBC16_08630 [Verrucomicrobia bacterium TMED56]|tara:strand:- start:53 stop:601 length:549 start_codon:yes stop_codon:yes gene_type:complete